MQGVSRESKDWANQTEIRLSLRRQQLDRFVQQPRMLLILHYDSIRQ